MQFITLQVDEKVQAVQLSMREVQGGVEGVTQLHTGLTSLKQSVTEAKAEMVASVGQQQARMTELENLLNGELKTLAGDGSMPCVSALTFSPVDPESDLTCCEKLMKGNKKCFLLLTNLKAIWAETPNARAHCSVKSG